MKPRIAVLGSINMDLVTRVARMPRLGETLTGSDFHTIPGGKGANQAVAAARLGAQVHLIGRVGTDSFGTTLYNALAADTIDLTHLHTCTEAPTGVALIFVDATGENCIVLAPGANAAVTPQDIEHATPIIAQAQMLICQLETPLLTVQRAIEIAKNNNTCVILNPAPAQMLSPDLLAQIDYLVPNETEAALLTDIDVKDVASAKIAVTQLRNMGAKTVVITLGAKGVVMATSKETIHLAAPPVDTVDTTAAGDTFVGGFAVGITEGLPLVQAVQFGQRAAALSVTRFGAQSSIPTRSEVDCFK